MPVSVSLNNIKQHQHEKMEVLSVFFLNFCSAILVRQELFVCCLEMESHQVIADVALMMLHKAIHMQHFKIPSTCSAIEREEVNLRTSSQSVDALSYLGSEA